VVSEPWRHRMGVPGRPCVWTQEKLKLIGTRPARQPWLSRFGSGTQLPEDQPVTIGNSPRSGKSVRVWQQLAFAQKEPMTTPTRLSLTSIAVSAVFHAPRTFLLSRHADRQHAMRFVHRCPLAGLVASNS
jgi:hypothetical protein